MSVSSRVEQLLKNALGEDIYEITPQSRVEALLVQLNEIIEGINTDPETIRQAVQDWLDEHPEAVVDTDTTYGISMANNVITLTGSDGQTSTVTLPVYSGGAT